VEVAFTPNCAVEQAEVGIPGHNRGSALSAPEKARSSAQIELGHARLSVTRHALRLKNGGSIAAGGGLTANHSSESGKQ